MNKAEYHAFLDSWQQVLFVLLYVALGLSILNLVVYFIRLSGKKSLKDKYDLASTWETRTYFITHVMIASALFFFVNILEQETVKLNISWFFIRLFVGIAVGVLYGYVAQLILKFYFPGRLEKKLRRLRYTPRINPNNGAKMKLLSEAEEDAYLDEGMQAEENVFSVDYDVWIDPDTGHTQIEKYKGHLSALECDRCGFQTLKLVKEEITKEATEHEDGELFKEYKCSYCNRIKRKNVVLSHTIKQDVSAGRLIDDPLVHDKRIVTVKLEIHTNKGDVRNYEFQSLDQTQKFIDEFDLENLEYEMNESD